MGTLRYHRWILCNNMPTIFLGNRNYKVRKLLREKVGLQYQCPTYTHKHNGRGYPNCTGSAHRTARPLCMHCMHCTRRAHELAEIVISTVSAWLITHSTETRVKRVRCNNSRFFEHSSNRSRVNKSPRWNVDGNQLKFWNEIWALMHYHTDFTILRPRW